MRSFDEMRPVLQLLGRAMAKYSVIDRQPFDFGVGMELYPAEIHMVTTVDMLEGASVTELAREFNVTKGAVSQQVAKLVKKGLLEKKGDPANGSRVIITTTDLGKTASDNHLDFHREYDKAFHAYLGGLDSASYKGVAQLAEEMNKWMDSYLE